MSQPVYDDQNIFAKILRGELPCNKVDECEHTLSFHDIQPQAPVHILVIPKGAYVNMTDFSENASAEEQTAYLAALGRVAKLAGVSRRGLPTYRQYWPSWSPGCAAFTYAYIGRSCSWPDVASPQLILQKPMPAKYNWKNN